VTGVLVLVHIPKTAGTTLAALLRYHYRGGAFRGAANALTDPVRAEARLAAIARTPKIRAVAGHVTVGLVDRRLPDAQLVTILRDPVDRTLSHYDFLVRPPAGRKKPAGRGLTPPGLGPAPPELTLEDALGTYIPDNLQTRMLCGIVSPYEALPADALELATANLDRRFAFVGTTERFDELLALLNRELGWPVTAYRAARPNPERRPPSEDARRLVFEHNRLDRELHARAGERFGERPELASSVDLIGEAVRLWNGGEGEASPEVEAALEQARLADEELERRKAHKRAKRTAG